MIEPKQVIVMRTDLDMPVGKMVAQGAHASLAVITNKMTRENYGEGGRKERYMRLLDVPEGGYVHQWLEGPFVKICLALDGKHQDIQLMRLYTLAIAKGIPATLITDAGRTCFDGRPTMTCVGIGPWNPELIDTLTGHLKLL